MLKIDDETKAPWNPGPVNFRAEQVADLCGAISEPALDGRRVVVIPENLTLECPPRQMFATLREAVVDMSPVHIDFEGAAADEFERRTGHRSPADVMAALSAVPESEKRRMRSIARRKRRFIRYRAFCDRNATFLAWALFPLKAAALAVWLAVFWFFWTGSPS